MAVSVKTHFKGWFILLNPSINLGGFFMFYLDINKIYFIFD